MIMSIADKDYLSIFDIELNKAIKEYGDKTIAVVCNKTKLILDTSNNLLYNNEKDGIHYYYRGTVEVIIDDSLNMEKEFYFTTKKKYKEEKR